MKIDKLNLIILRLYIRAWIVNLKKAHSVLKTERAFYFYGK